MQPTPNGPLHVGHAAGPYLSADALARHLRRFGCRVRVVSGSDVYENWVLLDSIQNQRRPRVTCDLFHRRISQDLAQLRVSFDEFITPLSRKHTRDYTRAHEEIVGGLIARGAAQLVRERFPVSEGSNRYVVGVWLLGRCPNCRAEVAGNACEECGYHFQPSEIVDPRSRLDEGPLTWREAECWFTTPDSPTRLMELVESRGASPDLVARARRYVEDTGGRVRLSIPSRWGIKGRYATPATVMCNTYFAYSVYCGSLAEKHPLASNAFSSASNVTTIGLFGIDNLAAGLVAPCSIALGHGQLKPFDNVVINHFLHLEGSKFSTSRRHAIWVGDLLASSSVTADELRYFLAHLSLEASSQDFVVDHFVESINRLRDVMRNDVAPELSIARPSDSVEPCLLNHFEAHLSMQSASLAPESFSLRVAVEALDRWLQHKPGHHDQAFWWLRMLALLAEPLMPDLAGHLWTSLGGRGRPTISALWDLARVPAAKPLQVPGPLPKLQLLPYVHLSVCP